MQRACRLARRLRGCAHRRRSPYARACTGDGAAHQCRLEHAAAARRQRGLASRTTLLSRITTLSSTASCAESPPAGNAMCIRALSLLVAGRSRSPAALPRAPDGYRRRAIPARRPLLVQQLLDPAQRAAQGPRMGAGPRSVSGLELGEHGVSCRCTGSRSARWIVSHCCWRGCRAVQRWARSCCTRAKNRCRAGSSDAKWFPGTVSIVSGEPAVFAIRAAVVAPRWARVSLAPT